VEGNTPYFLVEGKDIFCAMKTIQKTGGNSYFSGGKIICRQILLVLKFGLDFTKLKSRRINT
jgi:hypothetical protein